MSNLPHDLPLAKPLRRATKAEAEAIELQIIFKALFEHFQSDHSVMAAEQVYRLFGVPHRKLIEQGWLKGCDCGDCAGGLVPAGDLRRALDGIGFDPKDAPPITPELIKHGRKLEALALTQSGIEVLGTMRESVRQLREEIEKHWQALAERAQMENWDQHDKDTFTDATRSLFRESETLNQMLYELSFSPGRWL